LKKWRLNPILKVCTQIKARNAERLLRMFNKNKSQAWLRRFFPLRGLVAVFLFLGLTSPAYAAFPDLGVAPSNSYLERGFTFGWQFYQAIAGQISSAGGVLFYLALTSALIGLVFIVLRSGSLGLPKILAWFFLLIVLIIGPYQSQLAYLSIYDNSGTGSASTGTDVKGFAPHVLAVHVGSMLYRVLENFMSSNAITNIMKGAMNVQALSEVDELKFDNTQMALIQDFQNQCARENVGLKLYPTGGLNDTPTQTFEQAEAEIINSFSAGRASISSQQAGVAAPPVILLHDNLGDLPEKDRSTYTTGLQRVLTEMGVTYPPDQRLFETALPSLVQEVMTRLRSEQYTYGGPNPTPSDVGFYIAKFNTAEEPLAPGDAALKVRTPEATRFDSSAAGFADDGSDVSSSLRFSPLPYQNITFNGISSIKQAQRPVWAALAGLPVRTARPLIGMQGESGNVSVTSMTTSDCRNRANQLVASLMQYLGSSGQLNLNPQFVDLLKGEDASVSLDAFFETGPNGRLFLKNISDAYFGGVGAATRVQQAMNTSILPALQAQQPPLSEGAIKRLAITQMRDFMIRNAIRKTQSSEDGTRSVQDLSPENLGTIGSIFGEVAAVVGKVGIVVLAPFIGAVATVAIKFLWYFVDMALMAVLIASPVVFIIGLLIPQHALGVMILTTLTILVLKIVPVTFLLVDMVLSVIYQSLGTFDFFETAILIFAGAGMYTSIVGITLFMLFKVGDPAAVAQLTALDSAAKAAGAASVAATVALAGTAGAGLRGGLKGAQAVKAAKEKGAAGVQGHNKALEAGQQAKAAALEDGKSADEARKAHDLAYKEAFQAETGQKTDKVFDNEEEAFKAMTDGIAPDVSTMKHALLTAGAEAGGVGLGAASAYLPGGGGRLIQEVKNAGSEGKARTEARLAAEAEGKTDAFGTMWGLSEEAETQGYRQQFAGMLKGAAEGSNDEQAMALMHGASKQGEHAADETIKNNKYLHDQDQAFNDAIQSDILNAAAENDPKKKEEMLKALNGRVEDYKETYLDRKEEGLETIEAKQGKSLRIKAEQELEAEWVAAGKEQSIRNKNGEYGKNFQKGVDKLYSQKLEEEFQASAQGHAEKLVLREVALEEAVAFRKGGAGAMRYLGGASDRLLNEDQLKAQRSHRRTAGTRFAATEQAMQEYFMPDYDKKYAQGKISMADHYILGEIEKSADGVSGVVRNSKAIRRMQDMDWDSYNHHESMVMESGFRDKAIVGKALKPHHMTKATYFNSVAKVGSVKATRDIFEEVGVQGLIKYQEAVSAERYEDLPSTVKAIDTVVDKKTRKTQYQVEREMRQRDRDSAMTVRLMKSLGHKGKLTAPDQGYDASGEHYNHDSAVDHWEGELRKAFKAADASLSPAEAQEMAKRVLTHAAYHADKEGAKIFAEVRYDNKESGVRSFVKAIDTKYLIDKKHGADELTIKAAKALKSYGTSDPDKSNFAEKEGVFYSASGSSYVKENGASTVQPEDTVKRDHMLQWRESVDGLHKERRVVIERENNGREGNA
jgi:hypothetical protein